jgi:hypothetical protein
MIYPSDGYRLQVVVRLLPLQQHFVAVTSLYAITLVSYAASKPRSFNHWSLHMYEYFNKHLSRVVK